MTIEGPTLIDLAELNHKLLENKDYHRPPPPPVYDPKQAYSPGIFSPPPAICTTETNDTEASVESPPKDCNYLP